MATYIYIWAAGQRAAGAGSRAPHLASQSLHQAQPPVPCEQGMPYRKVAETLDELRI